MKALFDLVDANMEEPSCADCLKKTDIAEDYHYLLYMMAEAEDPDCERVKALVDHLVDTNVALLKRRLMALDGGRLWRRLLHTYFPELRSARVALFFKQVAAPKKIEVEPVELVPPALEVPYLTISPPRHKRHVAHAAS